MCSCFFFTNEDCEFSWRFLSYEYSVFYANNGYIEYRKRSITRKTMRQYVQYGKDDIKLLKEYYGKLLYDYNKPMANKFSPPIVFFVKVYM